MIDNSWRYKPTIAMRKLTYTQMTVSILDKTFKLFADCILVDGYARSAIYDVARSKIHLIPNDLYKLLSESGSNYISRNALGENSAPENLEILDEYITFLDSNELGFFCNYDEIFLFPPISEVVNIPSIINNSIIDIDRDSNHNYLSIFDQLSDLFCYHIQLRFHCAINLKGLVEIMEFTREKNFTSINLIVAYDIEIFQAFIEDEIFDNYLISIIEFYNCPEGLESTFQIKEKNRTFKGMFFSSKQGFDETQCGVIDSDYFTVNLEHLNESRLFNSCLNKKLSIDKNGLIKNCPSLEKHYGTLLSTSLSDAVKQAEFTSLWSLKKDEISICRSCEFRYACTDCRAYTQDGILGKPLKCRYDPFSATWAD